MSKLPYSGIRVLECPLWVDSGHSEARKLPNDRIWGENTPASVCFRPKADTHGTKKTPHSGGALLVVKPLLYLA